MLLLCGMGGIDEESLLLDMQETCTDVHTWYAQIFMIKYPIL
jgi:hypothetical protein